MRLRLGMASFLLFQLGTAQAAPPGGYAIDVDLPGPVSRYTADIIRQIHAWSLRPLEAVEPGGNPIQMKCVETPANERFVGVEQRALIEAPLERVAAVLDDFEHYKDLSPAFKDIHVISRDGNKTQTFWERYIPYFFMPNMKYAVTYLSDHSVASRVIYRYQLKESQHLRSADGLIVIENGGGKHAGGPTQFTRFDYLDPSLGIFATAPVDSIWTNSLEDIYLSSAGIRLKAEHGTWSYEKIALRAKSWLEEFPVSDVRARCTAHGTL